MGVPVRMSNIGAMMPCMDYTPRTFDQIEHMYEKINVKLIWEKIHMVENDAVTIIRDKPVTAREMSTPTSSASADELREIYYNKADFFLKKLKCSVCKKYDPAPSAASFQGEIDLQHKMMKQILFLQRCRAAIEQAVEGGRGEVRGETSLTTFIRQEDGLILVTTYAK